MFPFVSIEHHLFFPRPLYCDNEDVKIYLRISPVERGKKWPLVINGPWVIDVAIMGQNNQWKRAKIDKINITFTNNVTIINNLSMQNSTLHTNICNDPFGCFVQKKGGHYELVNPSGGYGVIVQLPVLITSEITQNEGFIINLNCSYESDDKKGYISAVFQCAPYSHYWKGFIYRPDLKISEQRLIQMFHRDYKGPGRFGD
jgi:hypothetical protein